LRRHEKERIIILLAAEPGRPISRIRLEILAEHFKIPKSRIIILNGTKARNKTIEVTLDKSNVTTKTNVNTAGHATESPC
jgi:hypothetical protein